MVDSIVIVWLLGCMFGMLLMALALMLPMGNKGFKSEALPLPYHPDNAWGDIVPLEDEENEHE